MIRKQLYLEASQDRLLKRLARERGTTEADIVRGAIDRLSAPRGTPPASEAAWHRALRFMEALGARGPLPPEPRRWNREDIYRERLDRYGRDPR